MVRDMLLPDMLAGGVSSLRYSFLKEVSYGTALKIRL